MLVWVFSDSVDGSCVPFWTTAAFWVAIGDRNRARERGRKGNDDTRSLRWELNPGLLRLYHRIQTEMYVCSNLTSASCTTRVSSIIMHDHNVQQTFTTINHPRSATMHAAALQVVRIFRFSKRRA